MRQLFYNKYPNRLAIELAEAKRYGVRPKQLNSKADLDETFIELVNSELIKWVVTESEQLIIIARWYDTVEIAHTVMTEGKPVLAAGQAEINCAEGIIYATVINNHSGHYTPIGESLEVGVAFFERLGIKFTNKVQVSYDNF